MNLKLMMSIKSVVCWIFGLAFIVVPGPLMNFYGVALSDGGLLMVRLLGAAFVLLALWLGLARETHDQEAMNAVAISVTVGDVLGAVILAVGILTGTGNALLWTAVILYLLLAIGFGYVWFAKPEGKLAV